MQDKCRGDKHDFQPIGPRWNKWLKRWLFWIPVRSIKLQTIFCTRCGQTENLLTEYEMPVPGWLQIKKAIRDEKKQRAKKIAEAFVDMQTKRMNKGMTLVDEKEKKKDGTGTNPAQSD